MPGTPRDSLLLVPVEVTPNLGGARTSTFSCGTSVARLCIKQKQEHKVVGPRALHSGKKKGEKKYKFAPFEEGTELGEEL